MKKTKVTGLSNVTRNLNREINSIRRRTGEGLVLAGKFVEGESNEVTPMEFGTLVNSSFTAQTAGGLEPEATVGYTANYAPAVHEMPETNNFTKPNSGPKFLERALKNNTREILAIIRRKARII